MTLFITVGSKFGVKNIKNIKNIAQEVDCDESDFP